MVYIRLATTTANFIYYVYVVVYNTFHIPVLFLISLLYQSSLIINQHAILLLKWMLQRNAFVCATLQCSMEEGGQSEPFM